MPTWWLTPAPTPCSAQPAPATSASSSPTPTPNLAGADSLDLLARAVTVVTAAGWRAVNVDCTVVLDRPRIAPIREQMERNLSEVVGAPVTIKGKRTEGLDSLGQGAHCWAVALVAAGSSGPPAPASSEGSTEEMG